MLPGVCKVGAGELAALIGVEDLRLAKPPQRLFQRIDAEVGVQRVRNPPGQRAPDRIAKLPFEPFVVFDRPLPRGGVTVTRRRR